MSYRSLDNKKYFDTSQKTWCNWIRYDALFCCLYESGTTIQVLLHFYWADRYPHIRIMDCEEKPKQKICWLTNIFWHAIWWASDFVRKFLFANMIFKRIFLRNMGFRSVVCWTTAAFYPAMNQSPHPMICYSENTCTYRFVRWKHRSIYGEGKIPRLQLTSLLYQS